jgi:predicted nuclease of predicted toxin-antitoxin system
MRILLDHCVPRRLGTFLTGHELKTARDMGWESLRNGKLLEAAANQFDLLLTVDRNIQHQQNVGKLPLGIIILVARTNKLADLVPLVPAIQEAIARLPSKGLVVVEAELPDPEG